jgi:hypothetical protein
LRKSILQSLSHIVGWCAGGAVASGTSRNIVPGVAVIKFWTNYCEAMRFTCEAQAVISARLMLFASGDPSAAAEAGLMIAEKVAAFAAAQEAAERALAGLEFMRLSSKPTCRRGIACTPTAKDCESPRTDRIASLCGIAGAVSAKRAISGD